MNLLPRLCFHGSHAAVALTGLLLGWMKYVHEPADPWAVVNHPWQPHVHHLHILAAPLLTGVLGWFAVQHGWNCWRAGTREGRRSGLALLLLIVPMVLSGYALQVSVREGWRLAWVWVHGASSVLWMGVAVLHVALHLLRPRRGEAASLSYSGASKSSQPPATS